MIDITKDISDYFVILYIFITLIIIIISRIFFLNEQIKDNDKIYRYVRTDNDIKTDNFDPNIDWKTNMSGAWILINRIGMYEVSKNYID